MTRDTQPPKFDAGNWVKMARFAAAASVLLSTVMAAILLMFDPPNQCPNWHLKDANSTPVWTGLAVWTMPLVVINCFIAVRWNWIARRAALKLKDETLPTPFGPVTIPVTYFMARTCVSMSLLSQFPVFLLVTECTDWLRG